MGLYPGMTKENIALIVIDMVNSCSDQKCEDPKRNIHFSKVREMAPVLKTFINTFKNKTGGTVIYTKNVPWQKEYLKENINLLYSNDPRASYYSKDSSEYPGRFYGFSPDQDDLVVTKNSYSAFVGTTLHEELTQRGIRYLIVTGIFTDGCVLATVVDGFAKGYNFVILKDLVETSDSKTRQDLQAFLKTFTFPFMYGETIESAKFLENWNRIHN